MFSIKKYTKGVRFTIFIMIAATLLLFFIGFVLFQVENKRQLRNARNIQDRELKLSFKSMYSLKSESINGILFDYACYDDMINLVKSPSKFSPEEYITPTNHLKLTIFQAYNINKQIAYVNNVEAFVNDTLVFNNTIFEKLKKKRGLTFFINSNKGILEIHASTIHSSLDLEKKHEPQGFIFIGKLWDKTYLTELSKITNAKLSINANVSEKTEEKIIAKLYDYNNHEIASIHYEKRNLFEASMIEYEHFLNIFFILLSIAIIVLCISAYNVLLLRPLTIIESSLDSNTPELLTPLINKKNEYSIIAQLINNYFIQLKDNEQKIIEIEQTKNELRELNTELLFQRTKTIQQNEELRTQTENLACANEEIKVQKAIAEEQNRQINDSIGYASMIQQAVLLPQFNISNIFSDHFIYYKPIGLLSGDFYWFKEFYGKYYFACADCTGHGLSGAMMSMLGISFLNELTHHLSNKDLLSSTMLNKLRTKIVNTLHQTGEVGQIRDGMDITLCIFNPETNELQYSSAYSTFYHITQTDDLVYQLNEMKGDKMPVGIHERQEPFNAQIIKLKKGDSLYLFTDGYIDQFGDTSKKKFNKTNFKNMILSIQHLSFSEQQKYISNIFEDWKKNVEQIDDVTVIGIKI